MLEKLNETICVFYKRGGLVEIDKIYFQKNNWYYSDGTAIKFVHHSASPVWKSHDGIIRLIDYSDKNEANEMIKEIERILYKSND